MENNQIQLEFVQRLAVVEVEIDELRKQANQHTKETHEKMGCIDQKLDELLTLKNKGMGAFWFASILVSSAAIGFITYLVSWFKGV